MKFRRIRTQPLCGGHPSWVLHLFLGMSELGVHLKIKSLVVIIHETLDIISLRECLCVTLL